MPLLLRVLLLFAFLPGLARAAVIDSEHLKVELVAEKTALIAGAANWVGLRLQHEPEWHTYWINAGDTGLATKLEWTLPEGWRADAVSWPAPQRLQIGELYNFGYSHEALLPVAIHVPANATGGNATLRLHASWLVCKEECIPGKAELSLTLPVAASGDTPPDSAAAPLLRAFLAQRPQPAVGRATAAPNGDEIAIRIQGEGLPDAAGLDAFAVQPQLLANAPARLAREGADLLISAARSEYFSTAPAQLDLVLVQRQTGQVRAWQVAATWLGGTAAAAASAAPAGSAGDAGGVAGVGAALLLALLGGIVLNLMPCVFPVLSLKALALAESAHHPAAARRDGLAYLAGCVAGFIALALILLALRQAGQGLGWGFQLQSPLLVALLAYLMVALGLSLSGGFIIGASLGGVGQNLQGSQGARGAFFTGLLACVVASPCTAPFMGPALGFALTQPAWIALGVFAALGLGLALPILALSFLPVLARWLPRPGVWMENFKQFLAWPLYLTAVWLLWVLMRQAGADATALLLVGLVLLIAALLAYGRGQLRAPSGLRRAGIALLLLAALAPLASLRSLAAPAAAAAGEGKTWQAWTPQRLDELRRAGKPVFVNMTAAWCITCLFNEGAALSSDDFAGQLRQGGITYLKGDWTNQDAAITDYLASFGRSGVPLYVIYPAGGGAPEVLPQLLTPGLVADALTRVAAGPSSPPATRSPP
jgi:thiol:disulfide interchange protein